MRFQWNAFCEDVSGETLVGAPFEPRCNPVATPEEEEEEEEEEEDELFRHPNFSRMSQARSPLSKIRTLGEHFQHPHFLRMSQAKRSLLA